MTPSITFDQSTIKIVYYTHPLCPVSWKMQEHWRRLLDEYGHLISFKFCVAADSADQYAPNIKTSFACQAVKTAALQSQWAADAYLDALRSAAMAEQQDISQLEVLVGIARDICKKYPGRLDFHRFTKELDTRMSRRAVQEDLHKIRINRIDRLPTITFTVDGRGVKTTGYNSYGQLLGLLQKVWKTGDGLRSMNSAVAFE